MPEEKALGVLWKPEDIIGFKISIVEKPLTRRGLLAMLSSIYDPLGLVSPFLLKGRKIIQELCKGNFQWDDDIPEDIKIKWLKWKRQLASLEDIKLSRCYKPENFGKIVDYSLHHFSDASEVGYGQASYLRMVNSNGDIHCTLLIGKSCVTPLKFVSIPWLELTAAVLSVKISKLLNQELQINEASDIKETFWTDSKVVLNYTGNESKRFKVFVANRIQMIRDNTRKDMWRYVKSSDNPADSASRGLPNKPVKIKQWFEGPEFLSQPEETWSTLEEEVVVNLDDDPEVKCAAAVVGLKEDILSRLEKFSSWYKMKRVIALILKFKSKIMQKIKNGSEEQHTESKRTCDLSIQDLQNAEKEILKSVQAESFGEEIKLLQAKKNLPTSSSIRVLDPYLDRDNLLRVGGRLRRSNLDLNIVHPYLLPKKSHVSLAVIRWCHSNVAHGGRGLTLNELRRCGFWIVNAKIVTRGVIFRCVPCWKLRGKVGEQKMANIPCERTSDEPPFTYCGIDMFGPFIIKERRSEVKRYGALFTCMASRAVHIEMTFTLDADSFIQALRCVIARRGNIQTIWSGNGSNFIGAERELWKAFLEMNHGRVKDFLATKGSDWIVWKKNPPSASHFGGIWERQIRTARSILAGLLDCHGRSLDTESLQTLLTECEAILNSRPLTIQTISDVNSPTSLAPPNLLTMKSKVIVPPPGVFDRPDIFSKKRWRRVQHIANEFWTRWKKEFLTQLQVHQKWVNEKRNFQVGDIVLLKEDSQRNEWPMAIIEEVMSDSNGLVQIVKLRKGNCESNDVERTIHRPISKIILLLENKKK